MTQITSPHPEEVHKSHRSSWLRASILGINDGLVSTSSLMLGVLASSASPSTIIRTGIAGLAAGGLSMAVGEYVSVSSQRDAERADIAIEERSLAKNSKQELAELAAIYEQRGLDTKLADKVARQLHDHDAVGAHARDELGIDHESLSRPLQAALSSAGAFSIGSLIPILAAVLSSTGTSGWAIVTASLVALAVSGAAGAFIGGGHRLMAASRVLVGGGMAMAVTTLIGHLIGGHL